MLRNDKFEDLLVSAFSHPCLGLVNILDSKKYQTGWQINSGPPRRKPEKPSPEIAPKGAQAP